MNVRDQSLAKGMLASMSEEKRAALNAKRRENFHHKKAERLAASGINVINFFYGNVQKMI